MIKTVLTAIITFLLTSIDEIPVLFVLYTDPFNRGKSKIITFAYCIGTFILISVSLLGAAGLVLLPVKRMIGLVGIIPIIMGLKILIKGDDDEDKVMEKTRKFESLWIKVFMITIALGSDDLGMYIPLFTTIRGWEYFQMLLVYLIGTAVLCRISFKLSEVNALQSFIEGKERFLVGSVYILLGFIVMYDNIWEPYFIR